ncbi:MAG: glycosyltransferase [Lentisphaeria bacterium]|nr:bifunctional glycosyltransferase/class I SAM-dependent methyltransferase [Lentisphaeria bacterium]NQZ67084.1 glycosyltransferase [Lentisphaeria bacterium]
MTGSPKKIGIFIVAYNASSTITSVLDRIKPETWERIAEVFIFDDHSADDTAAVADAEKPPAYADKIKTYKNQLNLGYGGNQKRGYRYAIENNFDIVVMLHGDGQYAPEALDELINPLVNEEADAVFGSRMMEKGSALKGGMPYYKYLGNKILTNFQNILVGEKLSEYHSGYRAYNVHALKKIPLLRNTNDFHFDNEIIIQLIEGKFKIVEVPIPTYYGDEICYVNGMAYAGNVFKTTVKYKCHKAGFIYNPIFDLGGAEKYQLKKNKYSSHQRLINAVGELEKGQAILDIGCGSGFLAKHLIEMGHSVTGVDIYYSKEAEEACTRFEVFDLEAGLGLKRDEQFDVIILADILEHMRHPDQLLFLVRKHLKPDGIVIASTGNVANIYIRLSLLIGDFSYTERGILDRTHYRLFTLKSFRETIQSCGFKKIRQSCCPIPFENIIPKWPKIASIISFFYMFGVWVWPSLFAYQVIIESEHTDIPTDLLRDEEIMNPDYSEYSK